MAWRRVRMPGFVLTPGAMGPVGQSGKRFGLIGALALGCLGWPDRLAIGNGVVGPQPGEHEEHPHQSTEPEVVEKEGWYHDNAPQTVM